MVDQQRFLLTIQLIGAGFLCTDLILEQSREHGLSVLSTNYQCLQKNTVLNLSIRLCVSASAIVSTDSKYTLQRLDHSELHSTSNHTLLRNPTARVKLTKAINRTKGLGVEDEVTYNGIWFPSLTILTSNDALLLAIHGEFFRYHSSKMTESEFYVKNVQEPISRAYEIIFETILFSSKSFIIEEEDGSFLSLSLDFSVMFRCPRLVCSDSAMGSSAV